jgi:hypothetical protein
MAKCILVKLPDDDDARTRVGADVSILFPTPKFLAKLTGTEEENMIHLADKDTVTGTKYEIIDVEDLPPDTEFRGAWEYTASANEKTSADLSLDDQLKYNKITQEYYDANTG